MDTIDAIDQQCQEWITQAEAARVCCVSSQTIKRWADSNLLQFRRLPSGRIQIDKVSLSKVIVVKN